MSSVLVKPKANCMTLSQCVVALQKQLDDPGRAMARLAKRLNRPPSTAVGPLWPALQRPRPPPRPQLQRRLPR